MYGCNGVYERFAPLKIHEQNTWLHGYTVTINHSNIKQTKENKDGKLKW